MQGISLCGFFNMGDVSRGSLNGYNHSSRDLLFNDLSSLFSTCQVTYIEPCSEQGDESDVYFIGLGEQNFCLKIFKYKQNDEGMVINSNEVYATSLNEVYTGELLKLLGVDTANATLLSGDLKTQVFHILQKSGLTDCSSIGDFLEQRPVLWMDRVYVGGLECLVRQDGLSQGQLDEKKLRKVVRAYLVSRLLATGDGLGEKYSKGGDSCLMGFFNQNSGNVLVDRDGNIVLLDQKLGVGEGDSCNLSHGDDLSCSKEIRAKLVLWWEDIIHELSKPDINGSSGDFQLNDTLQSAISSIFNYHENIDVPVQDDNYRNYQIQVIKAMQDVLSEFKQINYSEFKQYLHASGISVDLKNHILSIYKMLNPSILDMKFLQMSLTSMSCGCLCR